jgi:hypothetical protein
MATTSVQLIGPDGQDKHENLKLYIGRWHLLTYTHPVQFMGGTATVSHEDLVALQSLGVVRVVE